MFSSTIAASRLKLLLGTASVAAMLAGTSVNALSNEWTGANGNDFYDPLNWSDGAGPGYESVVNNGSAAGILDLSLRSDDGFVSGVGLGAGADGSVEISIVTDPDASLNYASLYGGSGLLVGADGGKGSLTISVDGPAEINMGAMPLIIGEGHGSSGFVNLVGTGKDAGAPPEGPLQIAGPCDACHASIFMLSSPDLRIGKDGGTGVLTVDNASLSYMGRGEFIIGDGAGSNGTLNLLADGKLGDSYNYTYPDAPTKGRFTVGFDGGAGTVNVSGAGSDDRNDAPVAFLAHGVVMGQGAGSNGSFNLISQGKVHAFIDYGLGEKLAGFGLERSEFDTQVGIDGGTGRISVSGDGAVWYQSGIMQKYLGTGQGIIPTDSGAMRVGETGTGELVIADGGVVRIGTATVRTEFDEERGDSPFELIDHVSDGVLYLGEKAEGKGVLSIGGAQGENSAAPGRLMAGTVQFGEGEGLIRFNHTSSGYVFDQFDDQFGTGASTPTAVAIAGTGAIDAVAGRTLLVNDQAGFTGELRASTGILQVNGDISTAAANILAGGILEGTGIVGATVNRGAIAPGQTPGGVQGTPASIGTLTVAGNYRGEGGFLALDTVLGDDESVTDRLVVEGDTEGTTHVIVTNIGGAGAQTREGIEVITVGGKSDGDFSLVGNEAWQGRQVVVAGGYAYGLYKGNASGTDTSDWYLRSVLKTEEPDTDVGGDTDNGGGTVDPGDGDGGEVLLTPAAQTYEAYPQALLGLNGMSTLQQRLGNRIWTGSGNRVVAQGADAIGSPYASSEEAGSLIVTNGVWGRIEGAHGRFRPDHSTTGADYRQNDLKLQAGMDGLLAESAGGRLVGGLFAQYVHGKTRVSSGLADGWGDGNIATDGYGLGGTMTWYGENGFYLDSQAQAIWYRSDLNSDYSARTFEDGNHGFGYALSLETGRRYAVAPEWSVTPQAQLVYSRVRFDDFVDVYGASVSLDRAQSLQGRLGLTLDRNTSWQNANGLTDRSHVYGIANLYYEFLDGTRVNLDQQSYASRNDRVWGGLGLGGSYNWNDDKYAIYGEGIVNTSLSDFADSYSVKGNIGFRVKW